MRLKQIDILDEITEIAIEQMGEKSYYCVSRLFLDVFNNWNRAAILTKLAYYQFEERGEEGYFHKTYEDLSKELRISERSLKNYMKEFRLLGIIEMKYRRVDGFRVSHYAIDIPALTEFCNRKLKDVE